MRIVDVQERTIGISRYAVPQPGAALLTTSLVAVVTDVRRDGEPIVGYGFSSVGRYGQGGLIRERFLPRLLEADQADLVTEDGGNLDPERAWAVMMAGEKPGGHGERCVAVGTLDMALWDAAAKIENVPLHYFLASRMGTPAPSEEVAVYASGGYPFPDHDLSRLAEEVSAFVAAGFTTVKIKIGSMGLNEDLRRVETACEHVSGPSRLAVDAMNAYGAEDALAVAGALRPLGLAWLEDICDPHDFATQARVAQLYDAPLAAGESLLLGGRGPPARGSRGAASRSRQAAVRPGPQLRTDRLPPHHRGHGRSRLGGTDVLAPRRSSLLAPPGRRARPGWRRDQPAGVRPVPRTAAGCQRRRRHGRGPDRTGNRLRDS